MSLSYGDDYRYANERLNGSVITRKGLPVYINRVDEYGMVSFHIVGGNCSKEAHIKEFDLTPIKLGYINYPTQAIYSFRVPVRGYRQGIRSGTFASRRGAGTKLLTKSLSNCVQNIYPQIDTCVETIFNGEATSRAYHRKFSLAVDRKNSNRLFLKYRDSKVGSYDIKKNDINLDTNHQFLKEALGESLT